MFLLLRLNNTMFKCKGLSTVGGKLLDLRQEPLFSHPQHPGQSKFLSPGRRMYSVCMESGVVSYGNAVR